MSQVRFMANVFDVFLRNKKTNEYMYMDTLDSAGIDFDTQSKEVFGGKGNKKLGVLSSQRAITVKTSNPNWDIKTIAMQLGQEIITGAGVGHAAKKTYTVTTQKKITLPHAPQTGTLIMEKDGVPLVLTTDYTVSAMDVTFSKEGIVEGDKIDVIYYKFQTSANAQKIEIDGKKFAQTWEMVLKTFESNTDGSQAEDIDIYFPEAVPNGKFSINTQAETDASKTDIEFTILEGGSSLTGEIIRYPATE